MRIRRFNESTSRKTIFEQLSELPQLHVIELSSIIYDIFDIDDEMDITFIMPGQDGRAISKDKEDFYPKIGIDAEIYFDIRDYWFRDNIKKRVPDTKELEDAVDYKARELGITEDNFITVQFIIRNTERISTNQLNSAKEQIGERCSTMNINYDDVNFVGDPTKENGQFVNNMYIRFRYKMNKEIANIIFPE